MPVFDPNAYGRPTPKLRQGSKSLSRGKHRLRKTFDVMLLIVRTAKADCLLERPGIAASIPRAASTVYPSSGQSEHNGDSKECPPGLVDLTCATQNNFTYPPAEALFAEPIREPAVKPPEGQDSGYQTTQTKWPIGPPTSEIAEGVASGSRLLPDAADSQRSHTPPVEMSTLQKANVAITSGDLLKQLQDNSLQQISRKHATKKRDHHRINTTSLKDLDLARAPVDLNRPASSRRAWAQESLAADELKSGDYIAAAAACEADSHIPQAATERSSQTPALATLITLPQMARSKWATKEEMQDQQAESNSNAWGSAVPSDATRESNTSVKSFGKMLDNRGEGFDALLPVGFDGNVMPAPADWDERPRYSNNNPTFKHHFKQWQASVAADPIKKNRFSNGVPYSIVPSEALANAELLPDGISLVGREVFIDTTNAARYGYTDHTGDAVKYAQPTSPMDYADWGKLDPSDEDNRRYRNERTEDLVENWLRHLANIREASVEVGTQPNAEAKATSTEETFEQIIEGQRSRPKLNIYLRPATRLDLDELTRIYNYHVVNGTAPSETREISTLDMQHRMRIVVEDGHHAFIVAAKKNQRGAKEVPVADDDELSWRMGLPVTHKKRMTLTRVEMLVGFCCANDLTAPDFVEHTSAEVELYVDPLYRNMGVGKCLIDKMLEICDRSHRLTTDCAFHCNQEIRHMYGPGGRRDVHKLFILLRKWHIPRPATISLEKGRRHRKSAFAKTSEDDYDKWLKDWLESLGFEVEGFLKKIGAKQGR